MKQEDPLNNSGCALPNKHAFSDGRMCVGCAPDHSLPGNWRLRKPEEKRTEDRERTSGENRAIVCQDMTAHASSEGVTGRGRAEKMTAERGGRVRCDELLGRICRAALECTRLAQCPAVRERPGRKTKTGSPATMRLPEPDLGNSQEAKPLLGPKFGCCEGPGTS